jgi:hypothetical protein
MGASVEVLSARAIQQTAEMSSMPGNIAIAESSNKKPRSVERGSK